MKTREEQISIISNWFNRNFDDLDNELRIPTDPDSPVWRDLEEKILEAFKEAQIKSITITL